MLNENNVAAVIVAAGRGTRARENTSDVAKQYRQVGGSSVLQRTIERFAEHPRIATILVIIGPGDHEAYAQLTGNISAKLLPPVVGGDTRQESVFNGLKSLAEQPPDLVLIHDGVRPFVAPDLIDRVVGALNDNRAGLPALRVTDTLKSAKDNVLTGSVDRSHIWRAQTPQGFRFTDIFEAHKAAHAAGRNDFTDDSSIAEWHGLEVAIVEGDAKNLKLTTPDDFDLAEALLMQQSENKKNHASTPSLPRVGSGFDVHAFGPGDHVVLCGVKIPHDKGLEGHSDADVGLHALTDAIFGALCDGDIGAHFPPSDPKWRGADSAVFLDYAGELVRERGGAITHADVTLICQAPKVGPHRDDMRARIAEILKLQSDRVSVKATTTERLGFTGREEGIAAMATATVILP